MKILYIAPDFHPSVSWYANACTNFMKQVLNLNNNYWFVFTKSFLNKEQEMKLNGNWEIIRFSSLKKPFLDPIWQLISFFKLKKLINSKNIDLIFFETVEFWLLWFLLSLFYKNKILIRIHWTQETENFFFKSSLYFSVYWFFAKLFLRRCKNIISTCNYYNDFLKKYLYVNPLEIAKRNFFVLPNFSNENLLDPGKSFDNVLNKYWINYNFKKLFVTLGRLNADWLLQKWFEDLLYSIYLIKDQIKESRFLLIWKWEKALYIKNIIEKMWLNDLVYLIESIDNSDLQVLMCNGITVLLSRFEWFSMFALEALSNWSVGLFTDTWWHSDLIKSWYNWFIVKSKDFNDISEKILFFDDLPREKIDEYRQNSITYYKEKFSNDISIKTFFDVIKYVSLQK